MHMPRPDHTFMAATVADQRPMAIGYARVSTGRQAEKRSSLVRQIAAIREHAKKRRQTLLDVVEDTGSASKLSLEDRPALVEVLEQAKAAGAFILVYEVDRLVRSVAVLDDILAYGVPIHVVGVGQLRREELRAQGELAEAFSKRRSDEQRAASASRRAAG